MVIHKFAGWFCVIVLTATACVPKQEEIVPTTAFSYASAYPDLYTAAGYPAGIAVKFINRSTGGMTYTWSFGDGQLSTEKEPVIAYAKSGTYTVTLTTTSSTGTQRMTTQSIKILDWTINKITISNFTWNSIGEVPGWDNSKKADLTIDVGQKGQTSQPVTVGTSLYRSDPVKNVINTTDSFTIPVAQKAVMNPDVVPNFIVNLYGNDGTGNRLVFSSGASAVGYSANLSPTTNVYAYRSGPVTIECTYR